MKAEALQPSWWSKIPEIGHPLTSPEEFAVSLRELSPKELENYILFRASVLEEDQRPSLDILYDETPTYLLMGAAGLDHELGKRITQVTATLFSKFVIRSKEGDMFLAGEKRAISQLSWLVTFGLSKLGGDGEDLAEIRDSINYLAEVSSPNSMSDEFDRSVARALTHAQASLANGELRGQLGDGHQEA